MNRSYYRHGYVIFIILLNIFMGAAIHSYAKEPMVPKEFKSFLSKIRNAKPGSAYMFCRFQGSSRNWGPFRAKWPAVTGKDQLVVQVTSLNTKTAIKTNTAVQHGESKSINSSTSGSTIDKQVKVLNLQTALRNVIKPTTEIKVKELSDYLEKVGNVKLKFSDLLKIAIAVGIEPDKLDTRTVLMRLSELGLFTQEEINSLFAILEEHGLFLNEMASVVFMKADEIGLYCQVSGKTLFLFAMRYNLDLAVISAYLDIDFIRKFISKFLESLGLDVSTIEFYWHRQEKKLHLNQKEIATNITTRYDKQITKTRTDKLDYAISVTTYKPEVRLAIGPDLKVAEKGEKIDVVDVLVESMLPVSQFTFVIFPPKNLRIDKIKSLEKGQNIFKKDKGEVFCIWQVPIKSGMFKVWRKALPWSYKKLY